MAQPIASLAVQDLARLEKKDFVVQLGTVYEHGAWVAERFYDCKTAVDCSSTTRLAAALKRVVDAASDEEKLKLINEHPDLAARASLASADVELTDDSKEEQARAGLGSLSEEEMKRFKTLNEKYKEKFGIVFILAVRNATKYTIFESFERRIQNDPEIEVRECLSQVHKIAWMRLLQKFQWNLESGFLTCHILDTARGCPAAGMRVSLWRFHDDGSRIRIKEFVTNSDGRTGKALSGAEFSPGRYEWIFHAGPYFARAGLKTTGMPFLDEIPIRFGIDNPEEHYHVPLLVSPYSFSTYRGS